MPRARKVLIVFGCWTFVALLFAAHVAIGSRTLGRPESFSRAFAVFMTYTPFWFAVTPIIVSISRRFQLGGPRPWRSAAVHVVASLLLAAGSFAAFILLSPYMTTSRFNAATVADRFKRLFAGQLHLDMLRYWAVIAIEHAFSYHRQVREREVALAEARLEVLKRQLQPHFLFNTLNSISVLMFENVNLANRMLLRLSELLRAGLADDLPHEVSLERELAFLDRYLEIERMRFGDRLTIDVNVDTATLGARVPNLILQPIVENAIRYGVAAVDRPATVSIRAGKSGNELHLEVRDDGPGLPPGAKRGVGLSNTEARLRQLYGSDQKLELLPADGGGVLVSIKIPFRPAIA